MTCSTAKDKINATVIEAREASYQAKMNAFNLDSQENINSFLDNILEFKKILAEKTDKIEAFSEKLEGLTWFDKIDEECLKLLNDLIASVRDWRGSAVRQYVKMDKLRKDGIALEEIKNFKRAIDDLREIADDLESVFFHLPKNQNFQETTNELQLA